MHHGVGSSQSEAAEPSAAVFSDKILVFGNGGVKDARTWQESETLAPYVKLLVDTSRFISSRIKDGTMVLVDKEIVGNLNFTRYEEE